MKAASIAQESKYFCPATAQGLCLSLGLLAGSIWPLLLHICSLNLFTSRLQFTKMRRVILYVKGKSTLSIDFDQVQGMAALHNSLLFLQGREFLPFFLTFSHFSVILSSLGQCMSALYLERKVQGIFVTLQKIVKNQN